jgi:hypothetical protein
MGKPFRLAAPEADEDTVHRSVHDALCRLIAPPGVASRDGVVWWTVEHRGLKNVGEGINRKRRGVVAGIPDLHFFHAGRCFMIELKRGPKQKFSEAQRELRAELAKVGVAVELAWSINGVLGALSANGIPHMAASEA